MPLIVTCCPGPFASRGDVEPGPERERLWWTYSGYAYFFESPTTGPDYRFDSPPRTTAKKSPKMADCFARLWKSEYETTARTSARPLLKGTAPYIFSSF